MGDRQAKIQRLEQLMASLERSQGGDPVEAVNVRHQLAHAYRAVKRFDEALVLFEKNVDVCREMFGEDHLVTLRKRSSLANCYYAAGWFGEAAGLFERILRDRERALGPSHPDTERSRGSLENSYREAGLGSPEGLEQ